MSTPSFISMLRHTLAHMPKPAKPERGRPRITTAETLKAVPFDTFLSTADIAAALGIHRTTAYSRLTKLRERGQVECISDGAGAGYVAVWRRIRGA